MTSIHILVSNSAVKDIEELNMSFPNKEIYIYTCRQFCLKSLIKSY